MHDREAGPGSGPEGDGARPGPEAAKAYNRRRLDRLLSTVEPPSDPDRASEREAHNRRLLRRYPEEILDEGRLAVTHDIFHEDAEIRSRDGRILVGTDEIAAYLSTVRDPFEDLETEVVSVLASPTEAMMLFRVRAVHAADYFGVDPSGRTVAFPVSTHAIFRDGEIVWYGDTVNPLRIQPPAKRHGRHEVLDQLHEGVLVVDRAGRVVEANPAVESILGVEDGVVDEPVDALLDGTRLPETGSSVELRLEEGNRVVDVSASALTDLDDERIGRILVLRDVTDRARRREQLAALNARTDRLDGFVSAISHDLRGPLTQASGYLELARESCTDEHFEKVSDAHDRMEAMAAELLSMARTGTTVEDTEAVSLAEVARAARETVGTDAADLAFDLPSGFAVEADPDLLRHVLENLFRNALDHNDQSVVVTVGALAGEDPDGFYVADDGRGIPPDEREKVLTHGYTTADDGTGLGLAIVEEFVEAHDWSIAVTASADGGARFEIRTA